MWTARRTASASSCGDGGPAVGEADGENQALGLAVVWRRHRRVPAIYEDEIEGILYASVLFVVGISIVVIFIYYKFGSFLVRSSTGVSWSLKPARNVGRGVGFRSIS